MTTILVDHNMEGQGRPLFRTIASQGWLDLVPLRLVTFSEVGPSVDTTDRLVWRFTQAQQMLLLTNNRNMDGDDSLELTMREESTAESLPIVTIVNLRRLREPEYLRRCAEDLVETVLDLHRHLGTNRVFIP